MDLHEAARQGNYESVKRLLDVGCPINEFDHNGMTPLALASQSVKATTAVLKLLIDSGADPNLEVADGSKYSIGMAASTGNIPKVQTLLDAVPIFDIPLKEDTRLSSIAFMRFTTVTIYAR